MRPWPVPTDNSGWVCCQLGAREHYAVPRALHRLGRLAHLVTDAWMPPGSVLHELPGSRSKRLSERYHEELAGASVTHFTTSLVAHEVMWSVTGLRGWDLFQTRNQWFQDRAASAIGGMTLPPGVTVFAHSYAALEIFRVAKRRGWRCVLAQIDPGERHFSIVHDAALQAPEYGPPPPAPPQEYFDHWRQECALADRIIVNSQWSRDCLAQAGVPAEKMSIAPLAYEPEGVSAVAHSYPDRFSVDRPLRVLFVGQASVAKGIKTLLDSMALLEDRPIALTIVGERPAQVPQPHLENPRITWVGPVSRREVMDHYRAADVLIFPSLSDGFGMAQIEAQGWALPIVASRSCGLVVDHGINGLLLPEVTPRAIADAVITLVTDPRKLADFSRGSASVASGGLSALGRALESLVAA